VYGMHNAPGLPVGEFFIRPGALLASSDEFEIIVTGKGGHAAAPHDTVDATLVGAQILISLQTIVSRNIDPIKRVVLTVGTFETDSVASNVIAQTARLGGTMRTLDPECRALGEERVRRIAGDTASAFGATAAVKWETGYPATVNSSVETVHAADAARIVAGRVIDNVDPIMPSEDFAYMLEERPGAYIFIGNGDGVTVHHPQYNFNDDAIPAGCSWFAELIERRLPVA